MYVWSAELGQRVEKLEERQVPVETPGELWAETPDEHQAEKPEERQTEKPEERRAKKPEERKPEELCAETLEERQAERPEWVRVEGQRMHSHRPKCWPYPRGLLLRPNRRCIGL